MMKRTLVILLLIAMIFGSGMAVSRFYDQQNTSPSVGTTPLPSNPQIEAKENLSAPISAERPLQYTSIQAQITASQQSAVRNAIERTVSAVVRIDVTRTAPETFIDRLFDDPLFRRFFYDRFDLRAEPDRKIRSVGSGVIIR
ncbi:S1C family serine protease [Candidatus Acetothermia bacterium]|nr:S1C family serine protease [Candidatus Acetothermia bacterium]MCI2428897.1 S1C family serine protease [Candidatus Acetothermia bacterium]